MAHCNRVQRLLYYYFFIFFIFPSIKVDGQPQRAAVAALLHCSQRNQKLLPADAGPKTNALQPLLDRYETLLLCWKNWKRYQRQTVRLHRPLWKRLRVSPASATSVPDLYMQQKTCIFFAKFLKTVSCLLQTKNFELIPACRKQSFITKRGTRNVDVGTEMDFVWLQTQVNFPLSKEAPTMKIYRGEMAQVLVTPAPFLPSK